VTPASLWAGYRDDAIGHRLTQLAAELETRLGPAADLRRDELFHGCWWLTPTNPRSIGATWIDFGEALQVETLGGDGGRWELDRTDEDLDFILGVVEAAIAGRIVETFALGRSRVTVTLEDGTTQTEIGASAPQGCLPLPLWPRWGASRQYAPYR
jgi:hypothetical protein